MVVFSNAYRDYFKLNNLQLNLQLIPNYFKNEKFVKLNTIITNDNVHEEAKYFSCQTCDKDYTDIPVSQKSRKTIARLQNLDWSLDTATLMRDSKI